MERVAVFSVLLVPTLSPCASTLPVFLAVEDEGIVTMVTAVLLLLACTLSVMLTLVSLSYYGAARLKFRWLERNEKLVVGLVLCVVGVVTHVFHNHAHESVAD